jgi:hypothetical protein
VRVGRRVVQQTVAHLGEFDEHGRIEARALARRLIGALEQEQLFDDGSSHLTVPVRLKGIGIERSRQFGDVYLALALWRGMGLEDLCERLLPVGKERVARAKMAVLVAARFCEPSSELHIAEDWYRRTALCDLLQLGDEEFNKDRLYRGLDHLLALKAALEAHLSQRCGELFSVQNEVLLYDVTSTYFEVWPKPTRRRSEAILDLPRFRGEVRSWDQGTWFDCIVSSSLGRSFGSAESIFSSRPARCQGRRVERLSRTAGTLAVHLLSRLQAAP